MDSFDDLLAPSRHSLENNPFADPFSKGRKLSRSLGYCPPFAATDLHAFGTSQHFNSLNSLSNNKYGASSKLKSSDGAPMNSLEPAHADDDDNEPLERMRSPDFRESIRDCHYPLSSHLLFLQLHHQLSRTSRRRLIMVPLHRISKPPLPSLGSITLSSPPPSATESGILSPLAILLLVWNGQLLIYLLKERRLDGR